MSAVEEESQELGDSNLYPSGTPPLPPPSPPPPSIEKWFFVASSAPLLTGGLCVACKWPLTLSDVPFDNNSVQSCRNCGALTPRLDAIKGSLAALNMTMWSLFSCDMYIYDAGQLQPGRLISYKGSISGSPDIAEKWLRHDAWLTENPGGRYQANVLFLGFPPSTYFVIHDQWPSQAVAEPHLEIGFSWYRYGLSTVGAVPPWRQALFGAVTLIHSNPAAAVVLIAAGFEAFFLETMRIGWQEKGLDMAAFRRLDRGSLASLVEWLPAAIQLPSLIDAPNGLHGRWKTLVNQRRNDVVHRADVQVTSDQAQESLKVALDAITFLDPFALVRPHVYFVNR